MRLTPCDCPAAGWCERHACLKTEALFHLCRRNQLLFDAWEAAHSLNVLSDNNLPDTESVSASAEGPGLARRMVNFGRAIARHAGDGWKRVDTTVYDARLAVCRECASCLPDQMVCREPACGCQLRVKAWWASEDCPLHKWAVVPARSNAIPPSQE